MKSVFAIGFDKNGHLVLQGERDSAVRSAPCPFSAKGTPCGKWCVHCGNLLFEGIYFALDLTCGTGSRIIATTEISKNN